MQQTGKKRQRQVRVDGSSGWEKAYAAVLEIGRAATAREVEALILRDHPSAADDDVRANLSLLAVNDFSRGHYQPRALPRRTDAGHQLDLLFKVRSPDGRRVSYEPYAPARHGVWEIHRDPNASTRSKVRVRPITTGMLEEAITHAEAEQSAAGESEVLSEVDARQRVARLIVARRGQDRFRKNLLSAYDGTCAVTGSTAVDVLEAAHILPYTGDHRNVIGNGLLLRADIHTLFDLGQLWIEGSTICVATPLMQTEYESLNGTLLRRPADPKSRPLSASLEKHASDAKAGLLGRTVRSLA